MSRYRTADLVYRLGQKAEAVCRCYLSVGQRHGQYWVVGDLKNSPGRSLFVRLRDSSKGPAGKWQDAATGEHGDLLDVIRSTLGLADFADVVDEARAFLSLPHHESAWIRQNSTRAVSGSSEAAKRLFAMSQPINGTLADTYLGRRGITKLHEVGSLRYHPRCYYRPDQSAFSQTLPAMIAVVTDLTGQITGVHRTWLAPDGASKAPIATPRKAMGDLLGHAVRFGVPRDVMAAGEGIESILSIREVLPDMAMAAALSAGHLPAILFPETLRRLYVVRDNDRAGEFASDSLVKRAKAAGIDAIVLSPRLGDFNEDLCELGIEALSKRVRSQLAQQDIARFMQAAK